MDDTLWDRLRYLGFSKVDQLKSELKKARYLANLFDDEGECIELVKGVHGDEYRLHEVIADAEYLVQWKLECQAELEQGYRMDRHNAKRYCLRTKPMADSSEVYSELLGLDVKLQCNVSKSTYRRVHSKPGASKQDVETAARAYWVKVLVKFMTEANLPICDIAAQTSDPQTVMERAFGNRRMRTLRCRARAWKKVQSWFEMVRGTPFPSGIADMLDYFNFLIQEGATRGQLDGVCASLAVIEDAGQVPPEQRISQHRLWIQTVKSHMAELDQNAKALKRAPPVSVAMVLALEIMVADDDHPLYARALAWAILLCVWACMRVSDLEGLVPNRISLSSRGLRGILVRTKTTGPGKQVKEVPIFVDRNVSLSGCDWLKIGMGIWETFGNLSRDYFIFVATPDLRQPRMRYASTEKVASYFRKIFGILKKPIKQRYAGWRGKDEPLLSDQGMMFWSGHSMRHFLPTISASIGVVKDRRDYLGRWHVGLRQSADYVHTSRQIVTSIQVEVSKAICTGQPSYDENELMSDFMCYLTEKCLLAEDWVARHSVWRKTGDTVSIGMTWPTLDQSIIEDEQLPTLFPTEDVIPVEESETEKKQEKDAQFFVVISRRAGFRRLHKLGCCGTLPWDCQRVEWLHEVTSKSADAHCKVCLKTCGKFPLEDSGSASGSSSSTDDSNAEVNVGDDDL